MTRSRTILPRRAGHAFRPAQARDPCTEYLLRPAVAGTAAGYPADAGQRRDGVSPSSPARNGNVARPRVVAGSAVCPMMHNGFSPVWFVLAVSYPALALTKVRSFYEHRAADDPLARSVINEAGLFWRVLFLNLNYHSVHHDLPGVPWYGLKASICKTGRRTRSVTMVLWSGVIVNGCDSFGAGGQRHRSPVASTRGKS